MSEQQKNLNSDPIFNSLTIRGVEFRNRIMSTSHACGLEEDGGMPGETYQRYHVEKAKGGLGLTMFGGSAYVDVDSTWASGQLNMSTDRIIPYLQSFSQRVHEEGAAIMIQLTHLGRRGESNSQNWLPTIAPSMIRETGHRSFPKEMDRYDINRVIKAFGDAAVRAKQGGLDGMETMVGGHLIGQFLSPSTNHRTDEYGGSAENRCRFGLMVHEEIRSRVGDDFIVGMRFPIDEAVEGGMNFDECVSVAQTFERSGLVDYFNANYGRLDTELALLTDCMPGIASPNAPWLQVAGEFKKAVGLPVFHAARITDLSTARYAIKEGLLDMVAMTRAHIADPHIVNKIQRGEEERIRPCVGMTHCMGVNRPTCLHNPASARETHWPQIIVKTGERQKQSVVVGAGPAGLEAARILAERGHSVSIFDAASAPGGQLQLAAKVPWRKDVMSMIDWRISELAQYDITVQNNRYLEAEDVLAMQPQVVVIATGGVPDLDWLPGNELASTAWDVLSGSVVSSGNVIVYDGSGRHPGLSAAQLLHDQGCNVSLLLLDERPAAELDYGERVIWKRELASREIPMEFEWRLLAINRVTDGETNRLEATFKNELTGREQKRMADQIVVERGTEPVDELFQSLRSHSTNDGVTDLKLLLEGKTQRLTDTTGGFELHRIGDASSSRNVAAAMFDALRVCSVL